MKLHDLAEFRRVENEHFLTTVGRIIFNDRIERALAEALEEDWDPEGFDFVNRSLKKRDVNDMVAALVENYGASAVSRVLDAFKELGFHFATQAGITVSKNDVISPPDKEEILERYEEQAAGIVNQYEEGWITAEERKDSVTDLWNAATDEVAGAMERNLDELNPIFMMANSGARGSFKQIRQLAGMRGLMANPKGEIIERPIKSNFMEGLSVLEYFISTHGARKGLADTALRTADSGYLTRRLVDVAQDVIINTDDCKTKDFVEMSLLQDGEPNLNLLGRRAAKKFETKRGRELLKRNQTIDKVELAEMVEAYGDEDVKVPVRSPLKCELETGVCKACYGRAMATGKEAELGDAVGIIAAQSIGEPGTQLTMRTFHTGGVAGLDITQGLPRVVELFEARKPKGLAQLAIEGGKVQVEETDKGTKVVVTDSQGEDHSYSFPPRTVLNVAHGERIERGTQLNEGSLDPKELLAIRGRTETELYLVSEVQRVYKAQGVDINDKHIELIVRQMLRKVQIESKGSTDLLPGQLEDRLKLQAINKAGQGRRRHAGEGRGGDPRDHQGVARDGVVPQRRLVPGDHQGAHRRRPRGQAGPPGRPQGERDHRQADPGGHRPAALPDGRDRSGRAAAAPGRAVRRRRARRRARPHRRARAAEGRRRRGLRRLVRRRARGARRRHRGAERGQRQRQRRRRRDGQGRRVLGPDRNH